MVLSPACPPMRVLLFLLVLAGCGPSEPRPLVPVDDPRAYVREQLVATATPSCTRVTATPTTSTTVGARRMVDRIVREAVPAWRRRRSGHRPQRALRAETGGSDAVLERVADVRLGTTRRVGL